MTYNIEQIEDKIREAYDALKAAQDLQREAEQKLKEAKHLKKIAETPIVWKNIFNTSFSPFGSMETALGVAQRMGYPFMMWNDRVYDSTTGKFLKEVNDIEVENN